MLTFSTLPYLAVDALYRAGYSAGPSSTPRLEGKHVFLQARLSSDRTEVSLQGGLGNADIFAPRRLEATSSDSHRVPSCTPGASNAGPEDARRVKGRESRSSRSRTRASGKTRACATSRDPVVRPLVRPEVTFPSAVTMTAWGYPGQTPLRQRGDFSAHVSVRSFLARPHPRRRPARSRRPQAPRPRPPGLEEGSPRSTRTCRSRRDPERSRDRVRPLLPHE